MNGCGRTVILARENWRTEPTRAYLASVHASCLVAPVTRTIPIDSPAPLRCSTPLALVVTSVAAADRLAQMGDRWKELTQPDGVVVAIGTATAAPLVRMGVPVLTADGTSAHLTTVLRRWVDRVPTASLVHMTGVHTSHSTQQRLESLEVPILPWVVYDAQASDMLPIGVVRELKRGGIVVGLYSPRSACLWCRLASQYCSFWADDAVVVVWHEEILLTVRKEIGDKPFLVVVPNPSQGQTRRRLMDQLLLRYGRYSGYTRESSSLG